MRKTNLCWLLAFINLNTHIVIEKSWFYMFFFGGPFEILMVVKLLLFSEKRIIKAGIVNYLD